MMDWFRAGGFGMFAVLILGAAGIGFGIKAIGKPTAARLAALRSFPALIGASALWSFGTGLWAVNVHLSDEAAVAKMGVAAADKAFVGILGITEAAQALTLGGVLALVVLVLRMVAEAKHANTKEDAG